MYFTSGSICDGSISHKTNRSTLVTASAVSVSGMIGWVGLVIPHMMRQLVKHALPEQAG